MTAMSAAVGASLLAHGLHVLMVLLGLWGLAALLVPHALARLGAAPAPVADEHRHRVDALRAAVTAGAPGLPLGPLSDPAAPGPSATAPRTGPGRVGTLHVPLAVVASAAAAGVHAAVAPPHLREQAALGLLFLLAAATQLAWAALAQRPTVGLLRAGVVLQLAMVATWLASRTTGLPWEPLATRHPVGPWDVVCVAWELLAAAACLRAVAAAEGGPLPRHTAGWWGWHPAVRAAVGAAGVSLALLSLLGAPS
ncbi:hypothetical protein [Nocardioides litoris]|uniref:hypothetical protein n=1 Tax=Nocardioides litoris TaxID=1926648 RepID=UPI00111EAF06|nr:hypothetical protein [Nocardioides litoris]